MNTIFGTEYSDHPVCTNYIIIQYIQIYDDDVSYLFVVRKVVIVFRRPRRE